MYIEKVHLFNEFHFYFLLYLRKEKKRKRRISRGNKIKVCEPAKKAHTRAHTQSYEGKKANIKNTIDNICVIASSFSSTHIHI